MMPIQILELTVELTPVADQSRNNSVDESKSPTSSNRQRSMSRETSSQSEIINDCVEQVLKIIERKRER
jgi:hypothetical protein